MEFLIGVILFTVLPGVGLALLGWGLLQARRSKRAARWPTAPAFITHLDLVERVNDGTTWQVEVKYVYCVNGVEYESTRLAYGYADTTGREPHAQIYDRLRETKMLKACYNPRNPAEACLSHGMHRSIWI